VASNKWFETNVEYSRCYKNPECWQQYLDSNPVARSRVSLRDPALIAALKEVGLTTQQWSVRSRQWRYNGILNPPSVLEYVAMIKNALSTERCPVCHRPVRGKFAGGWVLHHSHETGLVVGLICHKCNKAMGLLDDNIELMLGAALYLKENG